MRSALTLATVMGLIVATGSFAPVGGADLPASLPWSDSASAAAAITSHGPRLRAGGRRLAARYDLLAMVSRDSLLGTLELLTSIEPFSGWRQSTTMGEAQAFDFVQERLAGYATLRGNGLEVQRSSFRTYKGAEFWETRLEVTLGGRRFEVPADASEGHRDWIELARRFDSDGVLNDVVRDPVVVEGPPLIIRSAQEIEQLTTAEAAGRVVLLEYAVIDRALHGTSETIARAASLLERRPSAVVMVTAYSNRVGSSHGTSAGFLNAFCWVEGEPRIPVLSVRLEDLGAAGVARWEDLSAIESARVTWDVDILEVGNSGYLVARIPGTDPSRAVILSAHIDSPNTPGALDDGSGSVALLEVARILDRTRTVPPVDVYLVWYGSHERGMYGSPNFTARNSELLDRTVAMIQFDCLGHPLDGIANSINLETGSYGFLGDPRLTWPDYLSGASAQRGITTVPVDLTGVIDDNSSYAGYDVPNLNMIFMDPTPEVEVHYANHLHDPYDTVELAALEADVFEDMVRLMLIAATQAGADAPHLRVTPEPDRRAVFVASHTEGAHMSPSGLAEFGMTLAWEGFDVDTVPYGRPVTSADLEDADLVVVLPVHDYPSPAADQSLYDEAWTADEIDALEGYVLDGGILVLTNSAHRLKYMNLVYETNEDWPDQNALAQRFGVTFTGETLTGEVASPAGSHPLSRRQGSLRMAPDNAVSFSAAQGETVYHVSFDPVVSTVDHGAGQVVVLGDLGILGNRLETPQNVAFWQNLAAAAR